jgi:predicted AAA+ superfamily ATPase
VIERTLFKTLNEKLYKGKAIIVVGPRQVGKTTLLKKIIQNTEGKTLELTGDDPSTRNLLQDVGLEQIRQIVGKSKIVFIDEAQRITGIGLTSKMISDYIPETQLILSGSSSFELTQETHEPLTGRKFSYNLWPISFVEWQNEVGYLGSEQDLENRLVFGFYPDVLNHRETPHRILNELADSYLFKDIMQYANIRKPEVLHKLVKALAHQVGSEVVYSEISNLIGLDGKTVANYINILEQAFIVFRLPSFSRNIRNEIKHNRKIYFYDNGIRNAVIGDLRPFQLRDDIGALWENFLVSERIKKLSYEGSYAQNYFWRTKQQQEIDYLEEKDGEIIGFEFKWNPKKKAKIPSTFSKNYNAQVQVINRDNFRDFVI